MSGGVGSVIAGGKFWDGFRNGAISASLNHVVHMVRNKIKVNQVNNPKNRILYDGKKVYVINKKGKIIYSALAFSGKGDFMNNPEYQNKQDVSPIPEGEYTFKGKDWNALSPFKQVYFKLTNQGDWGDYNVKLKYVNKMAKAESISVDSVNWRKGGIYQGITSLLGEKYKRDVTWGNNVANYGDTSAGTMGHEFGHIIQVRNQGWGIFQAKGIYEQLILGHSSYGKFGTNEYGAEKYLHPYGGCSMGEYCPIH